MQATQAPLQGAWTERIYLKSVGHQLENMLTSILCLQKTILAVGSIESIHTVNRKETEIEAQLKISL
jgi:hypothetical protein